MGRIINPSIEGGPRGNFTFDDGTGSMPGGMWWDHLLNSDWPLGRNFGLFIFHLPSDVWCRIAYDSSANAEFKRIRHVLFSFNPVPGNLLAF